MVYGYYSKKDRKFLKKVRISTSTSIINSRGLNLEDEVWIWHNSIIDASNSVTIKRGCQIGAFVGIFTHSSHMSIRLMGEKYIETPIDQRTGYTKGEIEIGEYTFIGSSSLIYPGTKIGKGSLILSGTHVKGNIPDYSIVSGNPCKIINTVDKLDRMFISKQEVLNNYFDKEYLKYMLNKYKS